MGRLLRWRVLNLEVRDVRNLGLRLLGLRLLDARLLNARLLNATLLVVKLLGASALCRSVLGWSLLHWSLRDLRLLAGCRLLDMSLLLHVRWLLDLRLLYVKLLHLRLHVGYLHRMMLSQCTLNAGSRALMLSHPL